MSDIINTIKRYPLSTFLIVVIWIICLIPVPETPLSDISMIDKWTHFVMYGTLSMCLWFECIRNGRMQSASGNIYTVKRWMFIPCVLCTVIMGGLIELAQAYLTTCRSGDWLDFLCNSIGVVLGTVVALILSLFFRRK